MMFIWIRCFIIWMVLLLRFCTEAFVSAASFDVWVEDSKLLILTGLVFVGISWRYTPHPQGFHCCFTIHTFAQFIFNYMNLSWLLILTSLHQHSLPNTRVWSNLSTTWTFFTFGSYLFSTKQSIIFLSDV